MQLTNEFRSIYFDTTATAHFKTHTTASRYLVQQGVPEGGIVIVLGVIVKSLTIVPVKPKVKDLVVILWNDIDDRPNLSSD